MLLSSCGGSRNDTDLSHGRSSSMTSANYGLPEKAPASDSSPSPGQWSSYFTQKASTDPYGLIGKVGASAKSSASGFVPQVAHRFYNTASGVHFYTLSEQERLWVQANLPHFTYEGQGFFAVPTQVDELSPVYRFYNLRTGSHFYTVSPNERDHVIATLSAVFKYEGIAWYGSTVPGPGWFPMYRFFNTATGTHFYTATPVERDNVRNTLPTFNYEGIAYYVRLSGELDSALTGADANSNGVRDSVEQVLSRLILDTAERQANMAVAASYDRFLTSPLPATREDALIALGDLACSEQAANSNLYESQSNGIARVVLDTDQRVDRFRQLLEVLDGGYLGSELPTCPATKNGAFQPKSAGTSIVFGREVRVLFVNGIYSSMEAARDSSSNLSAALEFDRLQNFNFEFFHNPNDGNIEDVAELRAQAQLSATVAKLISRDFIQINSNLDDRKLYYAMLGWTYKDLRLQANSMTPAQWRITGTTLQLAEKIKQIIEAGGEQRLILVPHSQGNFYVEAALGVILDDIRRGRWTVLSENQMLDRIRVFGVAPVSATSWNNTYISHKLDEAIQTGLPINTAGTDHRGLPFNTEAIIDPDWIVWADARRYLESLGADHRAHGFNETYLNDQIIRSENLQSFRSHVRDQIRTHMYSPSVRPAITLPHTGITADQCYQAGSYTLVSCSSPEAIALSGAHSQDGMRTAVNPMQFSDFPNPAGGNYSRTECVMDNVTGLLWEGKESDGQRAASLRYTLSYSEDTPGTIGHHVKHVNDIALCGFTDWRVPSSYELLSIANYGLSDQAIDVDWFPNTPSDPNIGKGYWSSDSTMSSGFTNWVVDYNEGMTSYVSRQFIGFLRLTRGESFSGPRFTFETTSYDSDAANNVALDHLTGLRWRRCSEGQTWDGTTCIGNPAPFSRDLAYQRVNSRPGWRIPNVKELSSIHSKNHLNPAIDSIVFPGVYSGPNTRISLYRSTTPHTRYPQYQWYVQFNNEDQVVSVWYRSDDTMSSLRLIKDN